MLLSCGVKAVNPCDLKGRKIISKPQGFIEEQYGGIASQSLI
jgi:hypothetical protein